MAPRSMLATQLMRDNPTQRSRSGLRQPAVTAVAALAAVLVVLSVSSMARKSLTFDELSYIPAGYSYWESGDLRLNREHPPLAKYLAGLPIWLLGPDVPVALPAWNAADQWSYGQQFFGSPGVEVERWVFWARVPSVALAVLLLMGVLLFARELYGTPAGILAATLCALSPSILAHARLATTDISAACFDFWTIYCFYRFTRRATLPRLAATGAVLGLALFTKYNAVLLLALLALWSLVLPFSRDGLRVPSGSRWAALAARSRWHALLVSLGSSASMGLVALVVLIVGYGELGAPATYFENLRTVYANTPDTFRAFLHGEFARHSHPEYFLVAFLVKTPLPILALLVLRLVTHFYAPREAPLVRFLVATAVLGFFALTSWKALGIGVRYLLPVYPLLFVFISGLWDTRVSRKTALRATTVAMMLWLGGATLRIHPDYLAYFNEAVGGPEHGLEWLDDSNLDWGQDQIQLREYLQEHGKRRCWVTTMTWYDPKLFGIDCTWITVWGAVELLQQPRPPPGTYALSVHELNKLHQVPTAPLNPLRDLSPITVVGHTFNVYER